MPNAKRRTPGATLRVIAPDPAAHGEAVCDLIAKVFHTPGYYRQRDNMRQGRLLQSHYDWRASRIGFADAHLATHWGVYDYQMRIGGARVRVAGVGLVATDADFRGRGWMEQTAQDSIEALFDAGYDLSFLSGIDKYYTRFGYVRAWPYENYRVRTADLPSEPAFRYRAYELNPRPDLWELYNRENATLTGSAVQPTFPRTKFPSVYEGFEIVGRRRAVEGYILLEPRGETLAVLHSAGDPAALLFVAGAEARKHNCKTVEAIFLHRRNPLAIALRRGNCTVETAYRREGGAMLRTVNLRSTLEKMAPELARRLAASHLRKWRGTLAIEDAREQITLSIARGAVRVVHDTKTAHAIRGGEHIVQLLVGSEQPEETVQAAGIRVSGDARALLPILFPCEYPQVAVADQI